MVEQVLRGGVGAFAQRGHRVGQPGAGAVEVDGDDRLVLEGPGLRRPGRRHGRAQARGLGRGAGQHDGVERQALDLPAAAARGLQGLHALAQPQRRAALQQPGLGRCGQRLAQRPARQQQVGRAGAAQQRIAQHAQEDTGAGLVAGGVERGHAQRRDQLVAHPRRQARAQLPDGARRVGVEAGQPPADSVAQQAQPLVPAPAAVAQHGGDEGRHRRSAPQPQALAVGSDQAQWQALQHGVDVDADFVHQGQRLAVRADQDVLAVVELDAVEPEAARASAQRRCGLEQRHAVAGGGGLHRSGDAGPAAADHGKVHQRSRQFVHIASQALRSGVSAMRWCST